MDNFFKNRTALERYRNKMSEFFGNYLPYDLSGDVLHYEDEFYEEDMVIWVDPLDGTSGFAEGFLHHITSLIGVCIKGRPRIGILHKPYNDLAYSHGRTYFGSTDCGVFIKEHFPDDL